MSPVSMQREADHPVLIGPLGAVSGLLAAKSLSSWRSGLDPQSSGARKRCRQRRRRRGLPAPERSVQRAGDDENADPHEDPGPRILSHAGAHARRVRILRAAARTVAGEEDHRHEGADREREPPPSHATPDRCTHDETVRRRRLSQRAGLAEDVPPRHADRMSIRIAAVLLLSVVAVLSACAPAPVVDGTVVPTEGPHDELTASAFVLDDRDGAEHRRGGVGRSFPPVCGGPTLTGRNRDDVEGEESRSGSTWGDDDVVASEDCRPSPPAGPHHRSASLDTVVERSSSFRDDRRRRATGTSREAAHRCPP